MSDLRLECELWTDKKEGSSYKGRIILREVAHDRVSGTVGLAIEVEGRKIGEVVQVYGQEAETSPWRVVARALGKLYPPTPVAHAPLRNDGICNALTVRGGRCSMPALPQAYYCRVHDRLARTTQKP